MSLKVRLNKEIILQYTTELYIYEHYFGKFTLNKAYRSPFRDDKNPSFSIRYKGTHIYHIDYACDTFKGDAIKFVMQLYDITYREALEKIDADMDLGVLKGSPKKEINKAYLPTVKTPEKLDIVPELKPFSDREILWWLQYGITVEDLKQEGIFSVKSYKVGKYDGRIEDGEICFGYKYDNGWKLYFPLRIGKDKWKSSISNSVIEGWENIKNLSCVIVTKSRKDRIVLQKLLPNVINVQNEGTAFLTEENVNALQHFREVYIWFDADEAGVRACTSITTKNNWKYINTPKKLLKENVKDASDWIKFAGNDLPLKKFLKQKKLL